MKHWLSIIAVLLLVVAAYGAQNGQLSELIAQANRGSAKAQNKLGWMFFSGRGVEQDYAKAVECYSEAAEQGKATSQYNLGNMYYKGRGVELNYTKAFKWFKKAAAHIDQVVRLNMREGPIYDRPEFAPAQYNLGVMYAKDQGVRQNYKKAINYYQKAAERGHAEAQYTLGWMYYNGLGVEIDYTEAINCFRKAAYKGYIDAQYNVGVMYINGQGVEKDSFKAYKWLSLSAASNHESSMYQLSKLKEVMAVEQATETKRGKFLGEELIELNDLDEIPRVLTSVRPVYPPALRGKGVGGRVIILFIVDEEGIVRLPRIESSSHNAFNKPALDAIEQWLFTPGMRDGKKVKTKCAYL